MTPETMRRPDESANARAVLRLPDGRRLGYQEIGRPDSPAVIYCHGAPSSGSEWRLFGTREQIADTGVRLIAPDRPGSGESSYQRKRRILDWPRDVLALADDLGVDRFAVLTYSGGNPFGLACAFAIPERLTTVVTVSGTAPFDAPGVTDDIGSDSLRFLRLSRSRPVASRAMSWVMGVMAGVAPLRMARQAAAGLPPPDAAVLADPELGRAFANLVYETTHGSPQGAQRDTALMTGPWGFDLVAIEIPVRMWHGTADRNATPAMARYLASQLPVAELTWLEGEGHVSAAANHGAEILGDLVRRAGR